MARTMKKKWAELSGGQRVRVVLLTIVQFTLQGLALRDLARRPQSQISGSKLAWAAGTFVNTLGPIAYFLFGRKPTPAAGGSGKNASSAGLDTAFGVSLGKKIG